MNNRHVSFPRSLTALIVICLFVPTAHATTDETAIGLYSYAGQGLRLQMLLDLDGMKHIRINGHLYPGTFDVGQTGSHDETSEYAFVVEDRKSRKAIRLVLLWGNDDAILKVVGFYQEWRKTVKPELDYKPIRVCVFEPKFHRIDWENLPSAQKK